MNRSRYIRAMPSRLVRRWMWCLPSVWAALAAAQQLSVTDRQLAVAKLWAEVRHNYAYWDRVRADWDSALVANLALAAGHPSDLQFLHALRRTLALLGDGESDVRPAPAVRARLARPPLELRAVEHRVFIADYA